MLKSITINDPNSSNVVVLNHGQKKFYFDTSNQYEILYDIFDDGDISVVLKTILTTLHFRFKNFANADEFIEFINDSSKNANNCINISRKAPKDHTDFYYDTVISMHRI